MNERRKVCYVLTMRSTAEPDDVLDRFLARGPRLDSLFELFDHLPQTYFYAKDDESRFVKVSPLFLENHGLADESQALGRTDHDFHPPLLAEAYVDEDRRVMRSRRPLPGQVWLVLHRRRVPRWYVSTKTPLFGADDSVVGIAGAMYRIEEPESLARYFQELVPVVRHIEQHYAKRISMSEMAALVGLSSTHFNRRFRELLRMTPKRYLQSVRIQAARTLLTTTSASIAEIATEVGFADQSHLTRRFRETTGMTPARYRARFVR